MTYFVADASNLPISSGVEGFVEPDWKTLRAFFILSTSTASARPSRRLRSCSFVTDDLLGRDFFFAVIEGAVNIFLLIAMFNSLSTSLFLDFFNRSHAVRSDQDTLRLEWLMASRSMFTHDCSWLITFFEKEVILVTCLWLLNVCLGFSTHDWPVYLVI